MGLEILLVFGLDNSLGLTPAMGYNTWNDFRCNGQLSDTHVRSLADTIVHLNLHKLGYTYLNLDDCWADARLAPNGSLVPLPKAFPHGLKPLADYVHSKGLKFGIYADRGMRTCAFRPGSGGYETIHARQFAEWGVDYLKYDSCWASGQPVRAFEQYSAMRDALNATGRPILYSLCGWNAWYAPAGRNLANSWRIGADCDEWANIYVSIRTNEQLGAFASQGAFNDADMLLGSNPTAPAYLTPTQVQAQFSMWAIMASPLLIGSKLLNMPKSDLETYSNHEVIAINQDALARQGRVLWSNCPKFEPRDNWWMSPWSMPRDVAITWVTILFTASALAVAVAFWNRRKFYSAGREGCTLSLYLFSFLALSWAFLIILYRPRTDACQQVWGRPLSGGEYAVCMINFAPSKVAVECDKACFRSMGFDGVAHVRDVIKHADLPGLHEEIRVELSGQGGSALFRLSTDKMITNRKSS